MFPLLTLISFVPLGSQGIDAVIPRSEPFPYTEAIDIMLESTMVHITTGYNSGDHWAESTGADDFEKAVQDAAVEFQESYVSQLCFKGLCEARETLPLKSYHAC